MVGYRLQDMESILGARLDGKVAPEIKRMCWEIIKHRVMAAKLKQLNDKFPETQVVSIKQ